MLDDPSSDKVASIEWSIALTARLLIKHRSGLHLRRPQVERRLRRILALWLHPALCVTFAWLRRCARQLRRATLSSGLQVLAHGPSSPPPDPEPNLVTKSPHDWSVRSRTAAMRDGRAVERPLHTPSLQRALRHWRRDVTSQRELRDQRNAWRVAVTVLGAARTLDRQQGALCRLAEWCRGRRARASTLVAASKCLVSIRARHATRRWQAAARAAALGASARLRLGDHAALGRARAGLRGLEAAAGRARQVPQREADVLDRLATVHPLLLMAGHQRQEAGPGRRKARTRSHHGVH